MNAKRVLVLVLVVGLLATGLLTSCGPKELGTEENPIVWVFVPSGETDRVTVGAQAVVDLL
jgi:phosphonate transport system substrate-binding protein